MIQLTEVRKYFGEKRALGPVSFEIEPGGAVGFLGLNGAGKTTLLRILATDLHPSAGEVEIGGVSVAANPHEVRKRIGYLPETPPLYRDMAVGEYLKFVGQIKGLSLDSVDERIREVEEYTQLTPVHDEFTQNLSHGYRQRVGIAQAIIHKPELLILDEPTKGLDPVQVLELRGLIMRLKEEHTILVSSHVLTEISQTCDQVFVLNQGELIASGSEDEISANLTGTYRIILGARMAPDTHAEGLIQFIRKLPDITSVEMVQQDGQLLTLSVESPSDCRGSLSRSLVKSGHDVVRLELGSNELENLFVELLGQKVS